MTIDLTPEQSNALLDLLRSTGEVSDKRIEELMLAKPFTKAMESAVAIVHVLACRKEHVDPESGVTTDNEAQCFFYVEDSSENPWEGKDHQTWLRETTTIMRELEITSDGDMTKFLTKATEVAGKVSWLAEQYPQSMKFIRRIIVRP